jgi:predicted nucleic acid-binding protein
MSHRPIIDAGPGLNFLSINQERLLIRVLGKLSAPETVQSEVFDKARQDERFRAAARVWRKLAPNWMQILSDDQTPELAAVVQRITQQPMAERLRRPKDLGEIMVIAHAVVIAEAGRQVTVLIDDGEGARTATSEINRLQRLRRSGHSVGSIALVNTLTVLEIAAQKKYIPDKAHMRHLYRRLREVDDGLPPIESTSLLSPDFWC